MCVHAHFPHVPPAHFLPFGRCTCEPVFSLSLLGVSEAVVWLPIICFWVFISLSKHNERQPPTSPSTQINFSTPTPLQLGQTTTLPTEGRGLNNRVSTRPNENSSTNRLADTRKLDKPMHYSLRRRNRVKNTGRDSV
jgi:hypothetical protein